MITQVNEKYLTGFLKSPEATRREPLFWGERQKDANGDKY
jgi:hypothetical protein